MMRTAHITVPSFATSHDGVEHFFGTRRSSLQVTPGRSSRPRAGQRNRTATVVVSVKQVHGTDVLVVDRPVREEETFEGGWDAVVTDQPGVMVTVRTADCVPVLLHEVKTRVVAAIHAGWRGAVAGIVPKTVALLVKRFGVNVAALRMAIGPSAGPCCYEVDEPVLARLREAFSDWETVVQPVGGAKAHLNLRDFVRRQAIAGGVPLGHVTMVNACTICHPDLFYSYRREGVVKATMISGIVLKASAHRPA
jgi:YfiH family protein